ncbi:MAG: VOC family protein [Byssovorax sp.]
MIPSSTFAYVVLRCADLERSRGFYQALGFAVVPEQHGEGLKHYSCTAGAVVIELYPLGAQRTSGVRIGLNVDEVEARVNEVRSHGGEIVRSDAEGAIVRDPDGHTLHLRPRVVSATTVQLGWFNGAGEQTSFEVRSVYDLLDVIRRMPGLFLGERSITALGAHVEGFLSGLQAVGQRLGPEEPPFHDFHAWIAARCGLGASARGWPDILLRAAGSEDAALTRFFEELDDFRLDRVEVFRRADAPAGAVVHRTRRGVPEVVPVTAFEVEGYLRASAFYLVQILPGERCRSQPFRTIEAATGQAERDRGIRADAWQRVRGGGERPVLALERVLRKLGIDPAERLWSDDDQDAEYLSCRREEVSAYFELYRRRDTEATERDVLCCFLLQGLNDHCSTGELHPEQAAILDALFDAGEAHADELAYWMDMLSADPEDWWPITEHLLRRRAARAGPRST